MRWSWLSMCWCYHVLLFASFPYNLNSQEYPVLTSVTKRERESSELSLPWPNICHWLHELSVGGSFTMTREAPWVFILCISHGKKKKLKCWFFSPSEDLHLVPCMTSSRVKQDPLSKWCQCSRVSFVEDIKAVTLPIKPSFDGRWAVESAPQ